MIVVQDFFAAHPGRKYLVRPSSPEEAACFAGRRCAGEHAVTIICPDEFGYEIIFVPATGPIQNTDACAERLLRALRETAR